MGTGLGDQIIELVFQVVAATVPSLIGAFISVLFNSILTPLIESLLAGLGGAGAM